MTSNSFRRTTSPSTCPILDPRTTTTSSCPVKIYKSPTWLRQHSTATLATQPSPTKLPMSSWMDPRTRSGNKSRSATHLPARQLRPCLIASTKPPRPTPTHLALLARARLRRQPTHHTRMPWDFQARTSGWKCPTVSESARLRPRKDTSRVSTSRARRRQRSTTNTPQTLLVS